MSFAKKMGEMFWDRNDEFMKVPPLQIHSANWLTSPSVLQAHHQSSPHHHAYHKKFHDQDKYLVGNVADMSPCVVAMPTMSSKNWPT
jgi:hypothetical protein